MAGPSADTPLADGDDAGLVDAAGDGAVSDGDNDGEATGEVDTTAASVIGGAESRGTEQAARVATTTRPTTVPSRRLLRDAACATGPPKKFS